MRNEGNGMPLKLIRSTLAAWFLFTALSAATAFAAVDVQVRPGFNVVGISQSVRAQYVNAFPLLDAWKAAGITAIESYDHSVNVLLRAEVSAGTTTGNNFSLIENSALFVYSGNSTVLSLGDVAECSALSLKSGFNLASFFCPPSGFMASDLINSLGISSIQSIAKFDSLSARWVTAAVNGTTIVGEDFPIIPGEGTVIYAAADVTNWITPRQNLTFNPAALTVHQEEAGLSLNLTIPVHRIRRRGHGQPCQFQYLDPFGPGPGHHPRGNNVGIGPGHCTGDQQPGECCCAGHCVQGGLDHRMPPRSRSFPR